MEPHYQLSDQEFITQFAKCTFTPQWFSHEAHLRLAFIHLQTKSPKEVSDIISEQIALFDHTFDEGTKFHRTLTEASVYVVHHFMQRKPECSFIELLQFFPKLKTHFKGLLLNHYSPEVLFGINAKQVYQQPDLLEFS